MLPARSKENGCMTLTILDPRTGKTVTITVPDKRR